MPSASKARKDRASGENGELLKGSSLGKAKECVIYITGVREAPDEFRSPLIVEIEEQFGCTSWAPNATAIKALEEQIDDNYDKWIGYEVTLGTYPTTNPQTKQKALGLMVDSCKKSKRKPRALDKVPF